MRTVVLPVGESAGLGMTLSDGHPQGLQTYTCFFFSDLTKGGGA
jgi:hypothetical protein